MTRITATSVEIFEKPLGSSLPLEEYAAKEFPGVLSRMRFVAEAKGRRASRLLSQHRHDGHAQIEVKQADLDWHVILKDDRGQGAAMTMEFGRAPAIYTDGSTDDGSEGIFVLHEAFGIPKKRGPRNQRKRKKNPAKNLRRGKG